MYYSLSYTQQKKVLIVVIKVRFNRTKKRDIKWMLYMNEKGIKTICYF